MAVRQARDRLVKLLGIDLHEPIQKRGDGVTRGESIVSQYTCVYLPWRSRTRRSFPSQHRYLRRTRTDGFRLPRGHLAVQGRCQAIPHRPDTFVRPPSVFLHAPQQSHGSRTVSNGFNTTIAFGSLAISSLVSPSAQSSCHSLWPTLDSPISRLNTVFILLSCAFASWRYSSMLTISTAAS